KRLRAEPEKENDPPPPPSRSPCHLRDLCVTAPSLRLIFLPSSFSFLLLPPRLARAEPEKENDKEERERSVPPTSAAPSLAPSALRPSASSRLCVKIRLQSSAPTSLGHISRKKRRRPKTQLLRRLCL